jgi:hypothetical protein
LAQSFFQNSKPTEFFKKRQLLYAMTNNDEKKPLISCQHKQLDSGISAVPVRFQRKNSRQFSHQI